LYKDIYKKINGVMFYIIAVCVIIIYWINYYVSYYLFIFILCIEINGFKCCLVSMYIRIVNSKSKSGYRHKTVQIVESYREG